MPEPREELFAALLRHWRTRRGLSQLDLAGVSGVSSRHVSFLETGRSLPSEAMVLRLAAVLDVPLRQVNAMLRAAGHPPRYPEPGPEAGLPVAVRAALDLMKQHHDPYPLLVVDRGYRLLEANDGATALLGLLLPPAEPAGTPPPGGPGPNLARLLLDPAVGGRVVVNHPEVAAELVTRIQRELLDDPDNDLLRDLLDDVVSHGWLASGAADRPDLGRPADPTLELRLRPDPSGPVWSFVLMMTVLQAPQAVALQDLRVESWFPADDATAQACRALVGRV
ncbi:helix-turn-helix domain-containing protein [Nocardioides sp.]|uniref:helix-turn-helix domain-containing protein n=1 Tax=Nocardioides sp. TaxID=35761 RepID=UPI0035131BA1